MTRQTKHITWFFVSIVLCLLILMGVYAIIDYVPEEIDANLNHRGIDTPMKLLLGGHLGHFFKFEFLGNINWLIIPILGHALWRWKRLQQWERAFVFMYILTFGLIALRGYFNYRYMMTLLPVTMPVVIYFLWNMLDGEAKFLRKYAMTFLLALILFNSYKYSPFGKTAATGETVATAEAIASTTVKQSQEQLEKLEQIKNRTIGQRIKDKLIFFKDAFLHNDIPHLQKNNERYIINPNNIAGILQYIDQLPLEKGRGVLSNNLPAIYYYTNARAVYYWCEDDFYYRENGPNFLFKDRDYRAVHQHIVNELKCDYIFTLDLYNAYSDEFNGFLEAHCTLEYQNGVGHQLFRINPLD